MKLLTIFFFPFQTVRCVVKGERREIVCSLCPSWLMVRCLIVHTNTNNTNHNTNTGVLTGGDHKSQEGCCCRSVEREGRKKKRGDQQEGRSCSVLSNGCSNIEYVGHLSGLSIRNRYNNNRRRKKKRKKKIRKVVSKIAVDNPKKQKKKKLRKIVSKIARFLSSLPPPLFSSSTNILFLSFFSFPFFF